MIDCPFCALSPDQIIWRSAHVVAIRDAHAVTPGHTLVVLKRHVETYFDASHEEQAAVWTAVEHIKADLDTNRNPKPDGYNVGFNAGEAAGQTVAHAHVHVIPRDRGDIEDPRGGVRGVIPSKQNYHYAGARPRLVTGGSKDPLLAAILPVLDDATRVDLALAFVFDRGVGLLHDRLIDVLSRPNSRIRILTGDYQDVTEPIALRHLLRLPLIAEAHKRQSLLQLKVYRVKPKPGDSFHPKAWILRGPEAETAWVGSSNLSRTALETGLEWNYQISDSTEIAGVQYAFEQLWDHPATQLVDDGWIDKYEKRRHAPTRGGIPVPVGIVDETAIVAPEPRPGIQSEALMELEMTRLQGNKSGLVVLATGLGKTYLSAFDSREFKRVLFVAHREEILTQAIETYRRVRPRARLGLFYGKEKDPQASILFASIQSLSSPEHLQMFDRNEFDYIVIDEFHHAAAVSYHRVIDHFEPKFMLGLTATPDRLDGVNLLSLCEGNLVYRCDIPRGIVDKQLSAFHYFGIGDATEYEAIPWRRYTDEKLAQLVGTETRAEHALTTLRTHTASRVKALGFCVTKGHADFMAEYFRGRGVDCAAVYSGSKAQRAASLQALSSGELEIVFCVDMFNEGVDVPAIDTVLMLRPTESSIVWLQQLGRGLRYVEGKKLTVLDFIGNHNVFLRRPEILLEALSIKLDKPGDPCWQSLLEAELPWGTQITFDLEARSILDSLRTAAAKAGSKAERWYRELRDLRGQRPSALEAVRAGWFKQLCKKGGSWFAFVASQDDLSAEEKSVFDEHEPWLVELELLAHERSYVMLVLLAMLQLEPFPGRIPKRTIAEWIVTRARRSAALMADLEVDGGDRNEIEALLNKDAFPQLAALGGGRFLEQTKVAFDSSPLATDSPGVLAELTRELVDLHLNLYLEAKSRTSTLLPPILDDDGSTVDARFNIEAIGDQISIVFHSRGGTRGSDAARNTECRKGLEIIFRRLSKAQFDIARIEVNSARVKRDRLTSSERTVNLRGQDYPMAMKNVTDHLALAREVGNAAKRVGQKEGTEKGNDTRTIRITLVQPVPAGELWKMLIRK